MIYCPVCGSANPDNSHFCSSCGSRITENEIPNDSYQAPRDSASYQTYESYQGSDMRNQRNWQRPVPLSEKPGNPSKNWAGITGFIMGLLSVLGMPILSILSIPGFIISIIGTKSQQRGLSIAGIVLSVIGFIIILLVLAVLVLFVMGSMYMDDSFIEHFSDASGAFKQALDAAALYMSIR